MGMDLKPVRPTPDAPKDGYGVVWGRYNWSGWSYLTSHLQNWGVELTGFSGMNDGDLIKAKKCREVADAIEKHLHLLDEENQKWLRPHIILWRTCGGYRQY